jgi:hypothetical protein
MTQVPVPGPHLSDSDSDPGPGRPMIMVTLAGLSGRLPPKVTSRRRGRVGLPVSLSFGKKKLERKGQVNRTRHGAATRGPSGGLPGELHVAAVAVLVCRWPHLPWVRLASTPTRPESDAGTRLQDATDIVSLLSRNRPCRFLETSKQGHQPPGTFPGKEMGAGRYVSQA